MVNCKHARYYRWWNTYFCGAGRHLLPVVCREQNCKARVSIDFPPCCPTCGQDMGQKTKMFDGAIYRCPECGRWDRIKQPMVCPECGKEMTYARMTDNKDYFIYDCKCGIYLFRPVK